MVTQCVCPDAENRRSDHQAVFVRVLIGFIVPESPDHGLRPVIGVLRAMPVRINSPVRLLLVLLP